MPPEVKFGLINEAPRPTDYIHGEEERLGGAIWTKKIQEKIVNGKRTLSWAFVEPEHELQSKAFETNGCVSFSGDNVLEYLLNLELSKDLDYRKVLTDLGLIKNGKVNLSDRRTAKGSGTDPNQGNTVRAVDDYLRNQFFCPEDLYPFPDGMLRDEYYKVMPQEIADFGKKIKPIIELESKYLPVEGGIAMNISTPEQIWEGLQYSPVWCSVDGGNYNQAFQYTHRVTIRGGVYGESWEIHDHYQNQIRTFPWNYAFGGCKIWQFLKKKAQPFLKVGNSILYLAKSGKYAGEYIGCGTGDTMLSIWGDYRKDQRTEQPTFPENYFNRNLTIQ